MDRGMCSVYVFLVRVKPNLCVHFRLIVSALCGFAIPISFLCFFLLMVVGVNGYNYPI